ncbi:MAG: ECF-type sigma factor [Planctomycetota bacterium]
MSSAENRSDLLEELESGDSSSKYLPIVYDELKRLAHWHMRAEKANHTLNTTSLVHEAYLRLGGDPNRRWEGRAHFVNAAARAMRNILVDRARRYRAAKRDHQRVFVTTAHIAAPSAKDDFRVDVITLSDCLERLEEFQPRAAQVVILRYFSGLGFEDVAAVLGASLRTVKRDWDFARTWLLKEMSSEG